MQPIESHVMATFCDIIKNNTHSSISPYNEKSSKSSLVTPSACTFCIKRYLLSWITVYTCTHTKNLLMLSITYMYVIWSISYHNYHVEVGKFKIGKYSLSGIGSNCSEIFGTVPDFFTLSHILEGLTNVPKYAHFMLGLSIARYTCIYTT